MRDTIAAVASGAGRAGIGVVRVSGPEVPAIAKAVTGQQLTARSAMYLPFVDASGNTIDQGIALRFDAPHSYTCLLYTSPSPRDKRQSRMPSSA